MPPPQAQTAVGVGRVNSARRENLVSDVQKEEYGIIWLQTRASLNPLSVYILCEASDASFAIRGTH
jgi:hypothetical protein